LRILAVLEAVYGALTFAFSLIFVFYIFMGLQIARNPGFFSSPATRGGTPTAPFPPQEFGYIFVVIGALAMLFGWAMAGLSLYSAKCLRERKNWSWVMAAACLNCLHVPLGTALGVFTIVVINRPSVRASFGESYRP
jgi:hypothetical protein